MEEKVRVKRPHRLNMEDRKRIDFTGITDVVSFDPVKVVLESDYRQRNITAHYKDDKKCRQSVSCHDGGMKMRILY